MRLWLHSLVRLLFLSFSLCNHVDVFHFHCKGINCLTFSFQGNIKGSINCLTFSFQGSFHGLSFWCLLLQDLWESERSLGSLCESQWWPIQPGMTILWWLWSIAIVLFWVSTLQLKNLKSWKTFGWQVSFCNSIATIRGGTHVQYVTDQIVNHILGVVNKKNKTAGVKPFQIKNHMWVFVNALIDNPTFDSQTKETLTSRAGSFGSKCDLSEEFLKKGTWQLLCWSSLFWKFCQSLFVLKYWSLSPHLLTHPFWRTYFVYMLSFWSWQYTCREFELAFISSIC
jgi:hypothetical protein